MAVLKSIHPTTRAPLSPCEILKKQTIKTADPLPPRKRVSFAESKNEGYANSVMNEAECRTLWHTPYEFKKMKEHTHAFAKQALKQDRLRADDDKSYSNIILRVYAGCCDADCEAHNGVLAEEEEKDLIFLVGKANSRTGLERLIVRELAYDKRFRRSEIVSAVLNIQAGTINAHDSQTAERMRLSCETISRASRLFAEHMATALEVSLR